MENTNKIECNILGILQEKKTDETIPFTEPRFCRQLCISGRRHGITVIIFHCESIQWDSGTVRAYTYGKHGWICRAYPIPQLIFNRLSHQARDSNERQQTRDTLRRLHELNIQWLSNPLPGKWSVYQTLSRFDFLTEHLPPTHLYRGPRSLMKLLKQHNCSIFLKPSSGQHGRSVLHLIAPIDAASSPWSSYSVVITGRNPNNEVIDEQFSTLMDALTWVHRFIDGRRYVIQPYLSLISLHEEPYDIRVLMQKEGCGKWQLTGTAARIGTAGHLTSNLRGGGRAALIEPHLEQQFGREQAAHLLASISRLSEHIPEALEAFYGRLVELGLDFGIDQQGRLWLLEVNSKPGRSVFSLIGNERAVRLAVENPILYARNVMVRHLRRVCP